MVAGCRVTSVYMFNGFIAFAVIMGRFVPVSVAGINTELILLKKKVPAPATTIVPFIERLIPAGRKERCEIVSFLFILKLPVRHLRHLAMLPEYRTDHPTDHQIFLGP